MKALLKLLVAHIKQFSRQRAALFWTIAFPIFFILLFGALFSRSDSTTFSVGMVNEDNSSLSQGLVIRGSQPTKRSFTPGTTMVAKARSASQTTSYQ